MEFASASYQCQCHCTSAADCWSYQITGYLHCIGYEGSRPECRRISATFTGPSAQHVFHKWPIATRLWWTCSRRQNNAWYIPHDGVYNTRRPDILRVVFDRSASYCGESLNQQLLQGPDQTNGVIGVLSRFRQYTIAFGCVVEAMFHQFDINAKHGN